MLTKVDEIVTPDFQKIENAISQVEKICDARIAYNRELEKFYRKASNVEIKSFLAGLYFKKTDTSLIPDQCLDSTKTIMLNSILSDSDIYEQCKKIILKKESLQETVDNLHFILYKAHHIKRLIEGGDLLNKQSKETFMESSFLRDCLVILEFFISFAEQAFTRDHVIQVSNPSETGEGQFFVLEAKTHITNKVLPQLDRIVLKEQPKELQYLAWKLYESWKRYQHKTSENYWLMYRDLHAAYYEFLDFVSALEKQKALTDEDKTDFLPLVVQKKREKPKAPQKPKNAQHRGKKKSVPKNKQKPKDKGTVILEADISDDKVEAVAEVVSLPVPQKTEATVDPFALKTQVWKDEVARLREEKQRAAERERQREREYLEKQRVEKEAYLLHKEEMDYQNAYQLLEKLNPRNLQLVQYMFEKPTPHCKIRYSDIEGLFGQEPGKLPGAITSVSGSHRKIVIQNTIGFFDEINVADNLDMGNPPLLPMYQDFQQKEDSFEIVGGTFKAHKSGQGGSTLPSIAIKLVCSTLERAGMTAENIAQYKKEKAEKSKRLSR